MLIGPRIRSRVLAVEAGRDRRRLVGRVERLRDPDDAQRLPRSSGRRLRAAGPTGSWSRRLGGTFCRITIVEPSAERRSGRGCSRRSRSRRRASGSGAGPRARKPAIVRAEYGVVGTSWPSAPFGDTKSRKNGTTNGDVRSTSGERGHLRALLGVELGVVGQDRGVDTRARPRSRAAPRPRSGGRRQRRRPRART